jgi:diadenosine tetraphosphatase ApaH/serine/threonine PP2A family protein phosphatase
LHQLPIPTHFLRGNAEAEVLRVLAGQAPGGLSTYADDEALWIAQALTSEHQQFIATWPATVRLTLESWGEVLFCHATPASDRTVFTALTPAETLIPIFAELNTAFVVCGHTHMQFDRTVGDVRVVNAGSVGMPFGHTGADWLLLDDRVELRHTDYDFADAAARIRRSTYPQAENFAANNVLHAPSAAQALAMLVQLETNQAWR